MTIYFYLKRINVEEEQPIFCRIQCGMVVVNGKRKADLATFATKVLCSPNEWDKDSQRLKGKTNHIKKKNQDLVDTENHLFEVNESFCGLYTECSALEAKQAYLEVKITKNENLLLSTVLDDYVADMENGTLVKTNGRRFKLPTIKGWSNLAKIIRQFKAKYPEPDFNKHNFDQYSLLIQKKNLIKFYLEFYKNFRQFCLDRGNRDNSIHAYTLKLKTIFGYLKREHFINTGDIQQRFYSGRDNFDVVAVPELVFFKLIKDYQEIRQSLNSERKRIVLDYMLLGGTVALRKSDMLSLSISRVIKQNENYIISTTTQKTETPIQFPLPKFLTPIIDRNIAEYQRPFPEIEEYNFNELMKAICKDLPYFSSEIDKVRVVDGKKKLIGRYHLHELISPHMLRRTAVSNMLTAGVPVNVIKAVGGWSPGSKTFEERYLAYNQQHANSMVTMYYEKIETFLDDDLLGG